MVTYAQYQILWMIARAGSAGIHVTTPKRLQVLINRYWVEKRETSDGERVMLTEEGWERLLSVMLKHNAAKAVGLFRDGLEQETHDGQ